MKDKPLEPMEQIGIAAVFIGLDLLCNEGKITASVCKMYVEGCHKKIAEGNTIEK